MRCDKAVKHVCFLDQTRCHLPSGGDCFKTDEKPKTGPVTSEEIVEIMSQYLQDNPNISLPYSLCVGYWSVLLGTLRFWGFKITRE